VPPQPAAAFGRPMPTKLWRRAEEMRLRHPSICSAPEIQRPQALSRTWTAKRLGMAGSLLAPTTREIFRLDRRASGQTVADWRVSGLASPHRHEECEADQPPSMPGKVAKMTQAAAQEQPFRPHRADRASCSAFVDQLWRFPDRSAGCPLLCRRHPWPADRSGIRQLLCNCAIHPRAEYDPDDEFYRVEGVGFSRSPCERVCDLWTPLYDLLRLLPAMGSVPRRAIAADRASRPGSGNHGASQCQRHGDGACGEH
jgi:hypothetical protein